MAAAALKCQCYADINLLKNTQGNIWGISRMKVVYQDG